MAFDFSADVAALFNTGEFADAAVYIDRFGVRHEDVPVILLTPGDDLTLGSLGVNVDQFAVLANPADVPDPREGEAFEIPYRGAVTDFTIRKAQFDGDDGGIWRISLRLERRPA